MSNGNGNDHVPSFLTDLGIIEEAERLAREDLQTAKDLASPIQDAVLWLERVNSAPREAKERLKEKIAEAKVFLEGHIRHEIPAIRRAVWRALLECEFGQTLNNRVEVQSLLSKLARMGFLREDPDGDLRAYGKAYSVSPDSQFGDAERTGVRVLLRDLLRRVKERLLTTNGLSWEELLAGKPGEAVLDVPPAMMIVGGQGKWFGGGVLWVTSVGGYIAPEDAMGSIEGAITEARDLGVKLLAKSLASQQPPFVRTNDPRIGGKIRLLFHLLKRAQLLVNERKGFLDRASVQPDGFFLQGQPGVCLIDFGQDTWDIQHGEGEVTRRIYNFFCLVKRENGRLSILAVPAHLGNFFASCMGEYEEGEKFEGAPQPLRSVLRAMYRSALKASEDAKKVPA